jgi:serine/threonine protein kinase/Flp pilus assembly protein TadD
MPETVAPAQPAEPDALSTEGVLAVPGYEILGELGRGGMGVVYKARQKGLNRIVALKMVLHAQHTALEERERFRREAEAVARLAHPNVVQVFEVGEHHGLPFLSLEFCAGGTLAERLDGTPWPPRSAARLIEQLARAVDAAHAASIVHRDLKPGNVLLTLPAASQALDPSVVRLPSTLNAAAPREPGTPASAADPLAERLGDCWTPKVSDFGLAKDLTAAGHTVTGAVVGTPSYMAPEQARGMNREVGPAADTYALGAILYELLTGRPPFKGTTIHETLMQVVGEEPVPPSQLQRACRGDLETICLKCLQKDPKKRYPSARDLAEDLRRYQAGEPIKARPVGLAERGWRWCRRNPFIAALLAAVALLLSGGIASLTVLWLRSERNRTLAEANLEEAESQRARAEQSLGAARRAIEDYFTRVSENKLLGVPGMETLRKELLEAALAYYKSFKEREANNPALVGDLTLAYFRVATITELIGDRMEARRHYVEALKMFDRLPEELSNQAIWQRRRGICLSDYGLTLMESGEMKEAGAQLTRARETLEQLVRANKDVEIRAALAKSYLNTALWHYKSGRTEQAADFYTRTRDLQEKVVAERPSWSEYKSDLSLTVMNQGSLLLETGKPKEALALYQRSRRIQRELVNAHPAAIYYRRLLGAVLHNIGMLHRLNSQYALALVAYQEAHKVRAYLAVGHADVNDYQNDVAETLNNLGEIQLADRRPAEALRTLKQSEEIFERLFKIHPKNTKFKNGLALAYNNVGVVLHQLDKSPEALAYHEKALKLRQELLDQDATVVDYHNNLADTYSNLGNTLRVLDKEDEARRYYQKSCAVYEKLIPGRPTTTKLQTNLALAYTNLGYLEESRDRPDVALQAFRKGFEVRQEVARHVTTVPRYQADLANSHFYIGKVLASQGEFQEGRKAYDLALAIQERLVKENKDVIDYRADLGRTYIQLGNLVRDEGKLLDAFQWYKKAREVWQKVVQERPDVAEFQSNLAVSHYNFGITLQDLRLALAALSAHKSGRDVRERLVKEHPRDKVYRRQLAESWNSCGIAELSLRRRDIALRSFEEARERFAGLVKDYPDNARYLSDLGRAHLNRGITLNEMGKPKEALPEFQMCLDRQRQAIARVRPQGGPDPICAADNDRAGKKKDPKDCRYRELTGKAYLHRGKAQRLLGRLAEAAEACREARGFCRDAQDFSKIGVELAGCVALLDKSKVSSREDLLRQRWAGWAVDSLRQAVRHGFDRNRLKDNADLKPLHDRDDFKALLETPPPGKPKDR